MVNFNSFTSVLSFINGSGYLFVFLLMIVGGSVITTVAAFTASLGYFNIFMVAMLSFLAESFQAFLFYLIGYFGRKRLIGDYGKFLWIEIKSLYKLETHFQNHLPRTLFFIKMTPFLSFPGLALAGVSHVPVKEYAFWNILIALMKAVVFSIIGFSLGLLASSFLEDKPLGISIFILVLIMIGLSLVFKHFLQKIFKKDLSLDSIRFFSFNLFRTLKGKIRKNKLRI
ncbi:MAG: hypothetical protein Q8Q04_00710 [archaeon]|nr:hypothetical protein [archaeon]